MALEINTLTTNILKYNLDDFNNVKDSGFNFELPSNTLTIISQISELVGDASYIKTPVFKKKSKMKKIEPYKSTLIKKDTIFDKEITNIKECINKLTELNYEKIVTLICNSLDVLIENQEQINEISNFIFERSSTNSCFVKVYAKLYAYLMGNYEIFEKVLEKTFPEYTKLFDIDDYETLKMDANNNYEGFCKLMRENEERRSLSRFISCMLLQEVIDEKFIIDIINTLFKKLFALVNLDENEGIQITCDVICDNIKIFILETDNIIIKSSEWSKIKKELDKAMLLDTTNTKSFQKKSKFKLYDIRDYLKKNNFI